MLLAFQCVGVLAFVCVSIPVCVWVQVLVFFLCCYAGVCVGTGVGGYC